MMRRAILAVIVLIGLFVARPSNVSAHVLEENNGVTSVLHIPPFDAPEAGVAIPLQFELGSDSGTFHLSDYKIGLTLASNGRLLLQQAVSPAFFGASDQGVSTVTFPKIGVYTLHVHGQPLNSTAPDFAVDYTVRVASSIHGGGMVKSSNSGEVLLIGAAVLILFTMVATRQIVAGGRYAKPQPEHAKPIKK